MATMKYRVLGHSGVRVSRAVPRHHDVRRPGRRGAVAAHHRPRARQPASTSSTRPTSTPTARSEEVIGRAIKETRHRWVLATKVANPIGDGPNERGLSRVHVRRAVEASLRRLQTDHIDLYYMHKLDPDTSWEQIVLTFGELIREGKIREWGLSNVRAWHIPHIHHLCRAAGVPAPTALQPYYNLMNRQPEVELLPACQFFGLGVVPYSPIARGVLSGKYKVNQVPEAGSRAARQDKRMMETEWRPESLMIAEKLKAHAEIARRHAGALGDRLGAQQQDGHLGHRRPAHLRAVDELLRRARLHVDARGRSAGQQPGRPPATPPRPATPTRSTPSTAGSRRWVRSAPGS